MGGIEKQLMLQRMPSLMKGGHPMLNLSNSVTLNQSGGDLQHHPGLFLYPHPIKPVGDCLSIPLTPRKEYEAKL